MGFCVLLACPQDLPYPASLGYAPTQHGVHAMCSGGAGGNCAPPDSTRLARPWIIGSARWLDPWYAVQPHFSA
eukprot:10615-Chlamydomonas_euryale.AAC.1